tara:strand:- start:7869 stop:8366 length:498 start_codon:yes stop_codon:yes gene_type:complete
MWTVIKYKINELSIMKASFREILGDQPEFYSPKIKYEKYINNKLKVYEKNILENYIICKHSKFKDPRIINLLKNAKGLCYFLSGCEFNQENLNKFIKFCKENENTNGFLKQSFFDLTEKTKAKFVSGPFTQLVFDIIENKGKKLKVLLNNVNLTISKKSNYLLYS